MGGLAESMLADAIDALAKRDAELAAEVVSGDRKLDQLEGEVNDLALRLLALRQPTAGDLRAVLAALKISSDLERAGDLAKNVAKRTIIIAKTSPVASVSGIVNLGALVQGRIKTTIDAFVARDANLAMDVWSSDEEVDQLHTSLFRELLTYMMEDPRNITPCAHLLFIAKNIERIGDHITNIAERIVFVVKGRMPQRDRHKEDESSNTEVRPFKKEN
jgi:phosphate transport system protein